MKPQEKEMVMPSGGKRVFTSVVALLIAGALGAFAAYSLLGGQSRGAPSRTSALPGVDGPDAVLRLFDTSQPLMPTGQLVTENDVADLSGYGLYLPPESPTGAVPEIWYSPRSNEVAVRYGSTLMMTYGRWAGGQDPAKEYKREAADWKVGTTEALGGNPAWAIPANAQASEHPPVSVVHVSIGGSDITLYSTGPLADLEKVAADLKLAQAPTSRGQGAPGGSA
jgi:hypothetical protein